MFQKDAEILDLKRQARVDYREVANELRIHPSAATQRCLGYCYWQPGERGRLINFLRQKIAEREQATEK